METQNEYPEQGTVIHATLRTQDLMPAFVDCLEHCYENWPRLVSTGERKAHKTLVEETRALMPSDDSAEWWDSEEAAWILNEELLDALNEYAPPDCYFGAHSGDGSDFGFWEAEPEL